MKLRTSASLIFLAAMTQTLFAQQAADSVRTLTSTELRAAGFRLKAEGVLMVERHLIKDHFIEHGFMAMGPNYLPIAQVNTSYKSNELSAVKARYSMFVRMIRDEVEYVCVLGKADKCVLVH